MRPRAVPLAAFIAAFALGCEPPPGGSDHPSPAVRAARSASISSSAPVSASAPPSASSGNLGNSTAAITNPGGDPSTPPAPPPCPPVVPAPEGALAWISGCAILISQPVRFDYDKEQLRPEAYPVLDAVADLLLRDKSLRVEIRAHINYVREVYSRDLSKMRAQSVMKYFIQKKGVDPAQLSAKGYGGEAPIADPKTEEGRKKNPRLEFVIMIPAR